MRQDFLVFGFLVVACAHAMVRGASVLAPLAILAIFLVASIFREGRRRKRADFVTQLKSYRRELRSGGTVVVDNMLLRYDTPITTYHLNVGILFTSIEIPSPYRVSTEEGQAEPFIYSLLSLISGWWAFPMGPILTLHFIRENLTGGEEMPVAMLIDGKLLARTVEYDTVKRFTKKLRGDKSEADERQLFTGEKSKSNQQIDKRTKAAKVKSAQERIFDLNNPKPPGVIAVEHMQAQLENFKGDFVAKLRKSIRVPKNNSNTRQVKTD